MRWMGVLLLASACAGQDGNGIGGGKEDGSQGLREYAWVAVDADDFRGLAVAPPFRTGPAVAEGDPEYPLVARLQAWADRVHEHMGQVPRPLVQVLPATTANAWVAGVPVCLPAKLRIAAGDPTRPPSRKAKVVVLPGEVRDNFLGRFFAQPETCATPSWDLGGYAAFFNALGGACRLEVEGDTLVVGGAGCRYRGPHTEADTAVVYATAPFITLTSELIAAAENEDAVLAVLLHELGHYYRSHALTGFVDGRYDFWYEQPQSPSAAPPYPVSDSAEIAARLQRLSPYPIPSVPGQRYSPRLTRFLVESLDRDLLACSGACACDEALAARAGASELSCFACSYVSEEAERGYLAYESALADCAPDQAIALDALRAEVTARELDGLVANSWAPATLGEALADLQAGAAALDAEKQALLDEIRDRRLGWYTAEQEADEVSLAWAGDIGFAPEARVAANLSWARQQWAEDPRAFVAGSGVDLATCERLQAEGWLEPPPLGNLHDRHHGACFRWFHLDRELAGHGYQLGAEPLPVPAWSWAQARAWGEGLRAQVPPPRPMALPSGGYDATSTLIMD